MSRKNKARSLAWAVTLAAALAACGSAPPAPGQAAPSSGAMSEVATSTAASTAPTTIVSGLGIGTGLNGKWTLATVAMTDGGTIPIPDAAGASIQIAGIDAMINTGCNTGSATIGSSASAAVLGPVALTKKACSEPLTTLETAMLQVLNGASTVTQQKGQLMIYNDAGTLTFNKG